MRQQRSSNNIRPFLRYNQDNTVCMDDIAGEPQSRVFVSSPTNQSKSTRIRDTPPFLIDPAPETSLVVNWF